MRVFGRCSPNSLTLFEFGLHDIIINKFSKLTVAFVTLMALVACGSTSRQATAPSNPNFFSGRVSDGTINTVYNPVGFSTEQVQYLFDTVCVGQLGNMLMQATADGMVSVSAQCSAWRNNARSIEFEWMNGSTVMVEIIGRDGSGNLAYVRQQVQM